MAVSDFDPCPLGAASPRSKSSALPRRVLLELTPSEAEFQRRVIATAHSLGYLAFHPHSSRHSAAGWPDGRVKW